MKIGDRVIVNGEYTGLEFKDEAGRIMGFVNGDVCIEFDNYVNGHSYCNLVVGRDTKPGHVWFVNPKMIKKEEPMKERIEALEKELAALKACQTEINIKELLLASITYDCSFYIEGVEYVIDRVDLCNNFAELFNAGGESISVVPGLCQIRVNALRKDNGKYFNFNLHATAKKDFFRIVTTDMEL